MSEDIEQVDQLLLRFCRFMESKGLYFMGKDGEWLEDREMKVVIDWFCKKDKERRLVVNR
uniref:Uncharacterized protein n=1 Tax=viral metagenome TaxID=1070528 RepID=A0A6H1ZH39_9ZZZZ